MLDRTRAAAAPNGLDGEIIPPNEPVRGRTVIDHDAELKKLERLASWLDARFFLPGTRLAIGLDSIFGLLPGLGDTLTTLPAAYIIYTAHRLGAPSHILVRMAANTGIDWAIGTVPFVGDLFDASFRSNVMNVDLLRRHLSKN